MIQDIIAVPSASLGQFRDDEAFKVFCDAAVSEIAETVQLPIGLNSRQLSTLVREAAVEYTHALHEPTLADAANEIDRLERAIWNGRAAEAFGLLSDLTPLARRILEVRAEFSHGLTGDGWRHWLTRQSTDLLHQEHRDTALKNLHKLLVVGAKQQMRNRPAKAEVQAGDKAGVSDLQVIEETASIKQSAIVRRRVHAPTKPNGRPRRAAERIFVSHLRFAVEVAAGEPVAHTAYTGEPSKFARFVAECFRLARVAIFDPMKPEDRDDAYLELAVWIINDIEKGRQCSETKAAWRTAVARLKGVAPISLACDLIEHGKATVVRVEAGDPKLPYAAALIEFPDVGRLSFLADGNAFTIACDPETRLTMMNLASQLCGQPGPIILRGQFDRSGNGPPVRL